MKIHTNTPNGLKWSDLANSFVSMHQVVDNHCDI